MSGRAARVAKVHASGQVHVEGGVHLLPAGMERAGCIGLWTSGCIDRLETGGAGEERMEHRKEVVIHGRSGMSSESARVGGAALSLESWEATVSLVIFHFR